MHMRFVKNIGLGFCSFVLYGATYLVYLNRYDACGGDPCAGLVGACPDVCVPTGIKHFLPIMVALLISAAVLTVSFFRGVRE